MASEQAPEQFTGLAAFSKEAPFDLKEYKYSPKKWTEDDVDIKIHCCGVCGSDIHTLKSGWKESIYPAVVGHEIVGNVIRVGANVKHVKVGDLVGVGAQSSACRQCDQCKDNMENYCDKSIETYNSRWEDGTPTEGGYSNYTRIPGHWAFLIPKEIPAEVAAPLLCAGMTVFAPLIRFKAGPGVKVGIVGIGGLGHLAVQFAAALGAEVTAISHNDKKKDDAKKLGAKNFLATDNEEDVKKHANYFNLIVCTSFQDNMELDKQYLSLIAVHGTLVIVGVPEKPFAPMSGMSFIAKGRALCGSMIGSPKEIREMLEFAAKHKVHPWIEKRPMKDASQVVRDMKDGKARFRYVLVNDS